MQYAVAYALRKTLDEIGDMTVEEFNGWIEFFSLKKEDLETGE